MWFFDFLNPLYIYISDSKQILSWLKINTSDYYILSINDYKIICDYIINRKDNIEWKIKKSLFIGSNDSIKYLSLFNQWIDQKEKNIFWWIPNISVRNSCSKRGFCQRNAKEFIEFAYLYGIGNCYQSIKYKGKDTRDDSEYFFKKIFWY